MTLATSKTNQSPANIGVFPASGLATKSALNNNSTAEIKVADKEKSFKELVEQHAFLGKEMDKLTKAEQYEIVAAYVKQQMSKYPFGKYSDEDVVSNTELNMRVLKLLGSRILNDQLHAIEEMKDTIIEANYSDVSEALDDAIEASRNRYGNRYSFGSVNSVFMFNAFRREV